MASVAMRFALVGAFVSGSAGAEEALPPAECLREVRVARIAEAQGDVEEAVRRLQAVAAAYPRELLPLEELLRLHREHRLAELETSTLRQELLRRLEDPGAALAPGAARHLAEQLGDDRQVLEGVRMALLRRVGDRGTPELLEVLALVEERLGLLEEARATLDRLLTIEPASRLATRAAYLDLLLGRWEAALELVEPRLADPELGPMLRPAYLELLASSGQLDRTLTELERLGEEDGEGLLSQYGVRALRKRVAWALHDAGRSAEAERMWRDLTAEDPDDIEAQRVLAYLYSGEEERQALATALDRQLAEELDPRALLEQGTSYLAAGDNERAREMLSRAAPLLGDEEAAWFNLGVVASRLERWEEAVESFERALAIEPSRAATYVSQAVALRALGRHDDAIADLEQALVLEPSRGAEIYPFLAECYEAIGEPGKAAAARAEAQRHGTGG